MIELTPQQHDALNQNGSEPMRAIDPSTKAEYVLVPVEVYDRLKGLLTDDTLDAAALMNEAMADDDANDPYLADYQRYESEDS